MSQSWYVKGRDKEYGPFTPAALRQLATDKKISATTPLRPGTEGAWVAANKVRGLFPPGDDVSSSAATAPVAVASVPEPVPYTPTLPWKFRGKWRRNEPNAIAMLQAFLNSGESIRSWAHGFCNTRSWIIAITAVVVLVAIVPLLSVFKGVLMGPFTTSFGPFVGMLLVLILGIMLILLPLFVLPLFMALRLSQQHFLAVLTDRRFAILQFRGGVALRWWTYALNATPPMQVKQALGVVMLVFPEGHPAKSIVFPPRSIANNKQRAQALVRGLQSP